MEKYLYLSLAPEALIASHLAPEEFGTYYATGNKQRSFDQAIFFEIDPNFKSDYFPMDKFESMAPHADGSPHKSVYLSVYRVLEHVPLSAFKKIYLTTSDGRTLGLDKAEFKPALAEKYFLYQDLAPSRPRVASVLNPAEYVARITSSERLVNMPKITFCDLMLGGLEKDLSSSTVQNLPYKNIEHLRDCFHDISLKSSKNNKVVLRNMTGELLFRTVHRGFYVGAGNDMLFYPMPSLEDLEGKYYQWWRSALTNFGV